MEADSILHADLLDILFANRNKEYGAYQLRKTYPTRVVYSLAITCIFCIAITAIVYFFPSRHTFAEPLLTSPVIDLSIVDPPVRQPQSPAAVPKPQRTATRQDTPPVIMPNNQVSPQEQLSPNEALENVQIGLVNQDGPVGEPVVPLLQTSTAPLKLGGFTENNHPEITRVEIEARFPGGEEAWVRFLERNLNSNIPVDNGAPAGQYTVVVSFVVDREGHISDVMALNDPGYGTAAEAVRVIKKSKQWIPAVQNGANVIYRQKEAITFRVLAP